MRNNRSCTVSQNYHYKFQQKAMCTIRDHFKAVNKVNPNKHIEVFNLKFYITGSFLKLSREHLTWGLILASYLRSGQFGKCWENGRLCTYSTPRIFRPSLLNRYCFSSVEKFAILNVGCSQMVNIYGNGLIVKKKQSSKFKVFKIVKYKHVTTIFQSHSNI